MSRWLTKNEGWLTRALRWLPSTVEPLRVRVAIGSDLAYDPYVGAKLDGLLQFLVVACETGRVPSDVFADIERDTFVDIPIPIADVDIAGRKIACASWGWPDRCFDTTRKQRQKLDADWVGGRSTIHTNGGAFKSKDIPYPSIQTSFVDFYVRGDEAKIRDLMRDAAGLSRNAPRGMGAIEGVEIDTDPDDRSLVYQGRPQRSLPVTGERDEPIYQPGSYDVRECSTRAPYWHRRSRSLCAVPIC